LPSSALRSFLAPAAEPKTKTFDSRTDRAKMLSHEGYQIFRAGS
jgi:hypothetical protein